MPIIRDGGQLPEMVITELFFSNIVVIPNAKQVYTPSHTYGLDRQWATATSTVKSNYRVGQELSHCRIINK